MTKPDNPPAFPIHWENHSEGMTLRDYFAAKAMQGMASLRHSYLYADIAEEAYKTADAMLKARET